MPVNWSAVAGVLRRAPLPTRPDDSVGFLSGIAQFTDNPSIYTAPNSTATGGHEAVLECGYRVQLPRGVLIQPDFQFISTLGGGNPTALDPAIVVTLRVELPF